MLLGHGHGRIGVAAGQHVRERAEHDAVVRQRPAGQRVAGDAERERGAAGGPGSRSSIRLGRRVAVGQLQREGASRRRAARSRFIVMRSSGRRKPSARASAAEPRHARQRRSSRTPPAPAPAGRTAPAPAAAASEAQAAAPAGHDPDADLGQADVGLGVRLDRVAVQQDLAAAAEGHARPARRPPGNGACGARRRCPGRPGSRRPGRPTSRGVGEQQHARQVRADAELLRRRCAARARFGAIAMVSASRCDDPGVDARSSSCGTRGRARPRRRPTATRTALPRSGSPVLLHVGEAPHAGPARPRRAGGRASRTARAPGVAGLHREVDGAGIAGHLVEDRARRTPASGRGRRRRTRRRPARRRGTGGPAGTVRREVERELRAVGREPVEAAGALAAGAAAGDERLHQRQRPVDGLQRVVGREALGERARDVERQVDADQVEQPEDARSWASRRRARRRRRPARRRGPRATASAIATSIHIAPSRFAMKPGASLQRTTVLPRRSSAQAITSASTVSSPTTSSSAQVARRVEEVRDAVAVRARRAGWSRCSR